MDSIILENRADRSTILGPSTRESEVPPASSMMATNPHGLSIHSGTPDESPLPIQPWIVRTWQRISSSLVHIYSSMDLKILVRFTVVIFSYTMGIATTYSVSLAPRRADDALPSINDDGFPMMIAQVAASLLSPLLFTIISANDNSTPLRQKIISLYYILLVLGVLMSFVSLLLYSLWPSGYRITNATIMSSLMFTVLGGWQFLEKCWDGVAATLGASEEIELSE